MFTPRGPHSFEIVGPLTIDPMRGITIERHDFMALLAHRLKAGQSEQHWPRVKITVEVEEYPCPANPPAS